MKKALFTIGIGLMMISHSMAQEDKQTMIKSCIFSCADKDPGCTIKTTVKYNHSGHPFTSNVVKHSAGSVNDAGIRMMQKGMKMQGNTAEKTTKRKRFFAPLLSIPQGCIPTLFEKYSKLQPVTCSCYLTGLRLNEGLFSKISFRSSIPINQSPELAKINNAAEGDGSFNIGLSEHTAIKLDLGFLSGSKGQGANATTVDDNDTLPEADLSVGVMFGL